MHLRCTQRLERPATGVGSVDDDRQQCVAEGGLDRRFPPGVDLDHIEQGPERAVHTCEVLGTRTCPSRLERLTERLGACAPLRQLVGGSLATLAIALVWFVERAFDLKLISG